MAVELREIRTRLDGLERMWEERDRRYEERFVSAKEAVGKQEQIQQRHDAQANGLQQRLDDQSKQFMSREESTGMITALRELIDRIERDTRAALDRIRAQATEEIQGLRESRSEGAGRDRAVMATRERGQWVISLVVAVIVALLTPVGAKIVAVLSGAPGAP